MMPASNNRYYALIRVRDDKGTTIERGIDLEVLLLHIFRYLSLVPQKIAHRLLPGPSIQLKAETEWLLAHQFAPI